MATILLSAAGAGLGAAFGPLGAMLGRAAGAIGGALIDQALIRSTLPDQSGPRLSDLHVQSSSEGRPMPRVYGRVRIAGELIWATHYEETVTRESAGGKGGPSVSSYQYFANFALGLCEGPILRVGRVWADGVALDLAGVTMRVHLGDEAQAPDALILARQGGAAPAYRGLAYVVFERLALEPFGNRIPQFAFEVVRLVDRLESMVRAVTLIPGATEFGLGTAAVVRQDGPGATSAENRHVTDAPTDFVAALDELTALCPNLQRVALVVSWFGSDLRAGHCTVMPGVESLDKVTAPTAWSAAGLSRAGARLISRVDGRPAYGGTPSDDTVVAAIRAIRARGLKLTFYPFVMMDIPAGNGLADPYGGAEQAAFPWRGRITCHPAAGRSGSPDKTAAAATQVVSLIGSAAPGHFSLAGDRVVYAGPAEWTLRRMILHCAWLAKAAGGVEAFLLGSELGGLTRIRSGAATYPFVAALTSLAADVKSVLGATSAVSYGADWSEWNGHQPADGSGDVYFHLDPFWSSASVDFIGIDQYAPLADWRHGDHLDEAVAASVYDLAYLRGNIAGGEAFDWYYASPADRRAQIRSPISDGAYGKPWVFRAKDLHGWWANAHYDRPGGVEAATPTAWVAQSKPIWLTELGCPAVDLGANQPNMFPDPKSGESGLPWFSTGARDDTMQRRFLEAVLGHYDPDDPDFVAAHNPVSALDGRRMVALDAIHLWTWDARPYPAFPGFTDVWADGANWATGHWLTGRLGAPGLDGLIRAILADYGFADFATTAIAGHVDGALIDQRMSARAALEPLLAAFLIDALDAGTHLSFAGRARPPVASITADDLIDDGRHPLIEIRRAQESELPLEAAVSFSDPLLDFRRTTVTSRRLVGRAARRASADLAVVAPVPVMAAAADAWLQDVWSARETLTFALAPNRIALEPGDVVSVTAQGRARLAMIERIEDGAARRIQARSIDPRLYVAAAGELGSRPGARAVDYGPPAVAVLDIPYGASGPNPERPFVAVFAKPWPGTVAVWRTISGAAYELAATVTGRATMGALTASLAPGPTGIWDLANRIELKLFGGALASAAEIDVLAGQNLAAVEAADGRWELLQFAEAELIGPDSYRLSRLLRAQAGTEDAWGAGMPAGSAFVLIDAAVTALPIGRDQIGLPVACKIGPAALDYTRPSYLDVTFTPGGRGLKPFSPVHLSGRRDPATGDVTFAWIRRSRASGSDSWTSVDVALGEDAERYRVEILSGSSVVRTIEVAAPSCLYSAAEQAADFGAPQPSYSIRVAQLSATVGAGVARAATVAV